jgi:hypothetical protein
METEEMDRLTDDDVVTGRAATLLALGALAYVIAGAFWMDAHGTGPESTLTLTSIVELLWAVFSWPLDALGVL